MLTKFYLELSAWAVVRQLARVPLPVWAGLAVAAAGFALSGGRPLSAPLMMESLTQGLIVAIGCRITIRALWHTIGATLWKRRLEQQAMVLGV